MHLTFFFVKSLISQCQLDLFCFFFSFLVPFRSQKVACWQLMCRSHAWLCKVPLNYICHWMSGSGSDFSCWNCAEDLAKFQEEGAKVPNGLCWAEKGNVVRAVFECTILTAHDKLISQWFWTEFVSITCEANCILILYTLL